MKIKVLKIRLSEKYQAQDEDLVNDYLNTHQIIQMTSSLITAKENYWSVLLSYAEKNAVVNEILAPKYTSIESEELNPDEMKILESLELWRSERSQRDDVPAYFLATNKELYSIAKFKPVKKEELKDIKGFGKHKIEHYGSDIIEILEQI